MLLQILSLLILFLIVHVWLGGSMKLIDNILSGIIVLLFVLYTLVN